MKRTWGNCLREYQHFSLRESIDYYELKQYEPWFDREYSELLDQRKEARL
jgi:hypothetical protein